MGSVVEVTAYTGLLAHERIEVEDTAVAILRFAKGAIGIIMATTAAYPELTARIVVHGDRGSAIIDDDKLDYFHVAGDGGNQAEKVIERYGGTVSSSGAGADPSSLTMAHRDQLQDFIEAVREDREPLVNVEEGRKPLAIILGIYESPRTGRPVQIQAQSDPSRGSTKLPNSTGRTPGRG